MYVKKRELSLKKIGCSEVFQNGSFPLPPAEAKEDLSPKFTLEIWLNTWALISRYCWGLPMMSSFGVLILGLICTGTPAIHWLQFIFSYPSTGSHGGFFLWALTLWSHNFVSTYLSSLEGSHFPCELVLWIQEELLTFSIFSFPPLVKRE